MNIWQRLYAGIEQGRNETDVVMPLKPPAGEQRNTLGNKETASACFWYTIDDGQGYEGTSLHKST
jgi:hypothetical protein